MTPISNFNHFQFHAGSFYSFFQIARRISTLSNIPFPDGTLARTFRSRYVGTEEGDFPLTRALGFPRIMRRYWDVASVMRQRGLVPFVHGQSAIWSLPQRVLSFLGYRGCQLLRQPDIASLLPSSEIYRRIETVHQERQRNPFALLFPSLFRTPLDHRQEFRDSLLAVTIGLFHLERNETPLSFVLGGIYGSSPGYYHLPGNRNALPLESCISLANGMIVQSLEACNLQRGTLQEFLERIRPLYGVASRLNIGQLLVFAVPYNQLPQTVYHSQSFGFPTGNRIEQVIRELSEGRGRGGEQARLLFSQETLSGRSPIEMINIMDGSQVQRFCQDFQEELPSFQEDPDLRNLLVHTNPSEGEARALAAMEEFYARIDQIIKECLTEPNNRR